MYGLDILLVVFMLVIISLSGTIMWFNTKKRVPVKVRLQEGTLTNKHYRNYITKVPFRKTI
ncbi:hypothetical protein IT72_14265 [Listeria monocytogenes]|nr:hypothetical protein [Listeria monocytogenes]EAE8037187.1 hypothetical protein [Listeria monocytogenes]EAE8046121.1 hypothetical protein [Listeria monocytogenes]